MDAKKQTVPHAGKNSTGQAATIAAQKTAPSQQLGKFLLKKKIGQGGMGAVYLASDQELKREVALKLLPMEKAENPVLVKRFKAEAAAAAQLKHDNIVAVYDAGESNGHLFIAMEYVEGIDVHALMRKSKSRRLTPERSVEIIKQVARALAHAHEHNIVHRDIKPSNLLMTSDGTVKLADFGLARSIDNTAATSITRAGTTVGTVDYMAPEQAQNSKSADIRSDLYSLGCAWFEMLTGRVPYRGDSVSKILHAHLTEPVPNAHDLIPEVPDTLAAVVQRLMAKTQDERYQTPQSLLEEIENASLTEGDISQKFMAALDDEDDWDETEAEMPVQAAVKPKSKKKTKKARQSGSAEVPARPLKASKSGTAKAAKSGTVKATKSKKKKAGIPATKWAISPKLIANLLVAAVVLVSLYMGLNFVGGLGSSLDGLHSQGGGQANGNMTITQSDTSRQVEQPKTKDNEPGEKPTKVKRIERITRWETPETKIFVRSRSGRSPEAFVLPGHGESETTSISIKESGSNPRDYIQRIARNGEASFFPQWVTRVGDVFEAGATDGEMQHVTVGPGQESSTHFLDLEEAAQNLPRGGGIIELIGDGPFVLPSLNVEGPGAVVLRATSGARPVVVVVPRPGTEQKALIELHAASLISDGIDWLIPEASFQHAGVDAFIELVDADFLVRNCSFTAIGTPSSATSLMRPSTEVADDSGEEIANRPRIFWENTVFRSNACTLLDTGTSGANFVAVNSLIVSGGQPVIVAARDAGHDISEKRAGKNANVDITLISSTVACAEAMLSIHDDPEAESERTVHFLTANSIVAQTAAQPSTDAALLVVPTRTRGEGVSLTGSQVDGLDWRSESSLYSGWRSFLRVPGDEVKSVSSAANWSRLWPEKFAADQIQEFQWPESIGPRAYDSIEPLSFSVDTLETQSIMATDDGLPGCAVAKLQIPTSARVKRGIEWVQRPRPYQLIAQKEASTVVVDLNEDDLAAVVDQLEVSRATVIRITGTGTHSVNPFVVKGKHLRLEFEPATAKSLVVQPREYERINQSGVPDDYVAFITVEDGSLEIVNGNFKCTSTTRRLVPRWFISAKNSAVTIHDSSIIGPMLETPTHEGLIRTVGQPASETGPVENRVAERPLLQIRNSFLTTQNRLIQADLSSSSIIVLNSVLVSVGDLVHFDFSGDGQDRSHIRIEESTFSVARDIFKMNQKQVRGIPFPLTMYVSHTVFAPPVDPGGEEKTYPVVMRVTDGEPLEWGVQWWGDSNCYSDSIDHFLLDQHAPVHRTEAQSFEQAWSAVWGDGHVVHPSFGAGSVTMQAELPHRAKIASNDFQFAETSQAAHWGREEQPVGASPAYWSTFARKQPLKTGLVELAGELPKVTKNEETSPEPDGIKKTTRTVRNPGF